MKPMLNAPGSEGDAFACTRRYQAFALAPVLKAPGTKRLKLKYDEATGFKFCTQFRLAPLQPGQHTAVHCQ